jgi:hypothetical protein
MPNLRSAAVSLGAVLVMIAGSAGVAHATTTNVVTAIKAQDKILKNSQGLKDLNHLKVSSPAQIKKFVPDLTKLKNADAHAVTVVSTSSTTSPRQRQGKADWIKGSKEQIRGLLKVRSAFEDLLAGRKTAFKSDYVKGIKELEAGAHLGSRGDKLLGLPSAD